MKSINLFVLGQIDDIAFTFFCKALWDNWGYENRNSHERNINHFDEMKEISWEPSSTKMHCDCRRCNMTYGQLL